jgi:hypothetical protein
VHKALETFMESYQEPILLTYGNKGKVHPTVFVTSMACNDNEEAFKLANVKPRSNAQPCRYCTMEKRHVNCTPVSLDPLTNRNAAYLCELGKKTEVCLWKYYARPYGGRSLLSDQEEALMDECDMNGIHLGYNKLHEIYEWLRKNEVGDLFTLAIFDNMHTFYKGPVEQCIRYTTTCIYLVLGKVYYCIFSHASLTFFPLYILRTWNNLQT